MKCRLCGGKVRKFLDLGKVPLPEQFITKRELDYPVEHYPLNLVYCIKCSHVQLGSQVPKDIIYKKNYFYDYSITKTGLNHWKKLAHSIYKDFNLSKNDIVLDIGSNTGVLLSIFKNLGARILGVDPAIKQVRLAKKSGIPTINDYFSTELAKKILRQFGKIKIITCTNTFDHVEDLDDFMRGISILLQDDGVFIIEVPYFLNMLKDLSHVVYHQQIDYVMLKNLIPFFKKYELYLSDAYQIPIHGGSIRIYASFQEKWNKNVSLLIGQEEKLYKNWPFVLKNFSQKVQKQKNDLVRILKNIKKQGKSIAGVGASAKGINLLNYSGLGKETIDFITEKSPMKISLFTPSGIPITSDKELFLKKPDFALILAWNFKGEIVKNLSKYKKNGGKFIFK